MIYQIIKMINKTNTVRASITNLNKRNCLWVHSTETCIIDPSVARKVQRRGLNRKWTGIEDDWCVGKYCTPLHLINIDYWCKRYRQSPYLHRGMRHYFVAQRRKIRTAKHQVDRRPRLCAYGHPLLQASVCMAERYFSFSSRKKTVNMHESHLMAPYVWETRLERLLPVDKYDLCLGQLF